MHTQTVLAPDPLALWFCNAPPWCAEQVLFSISTLVLEPQCPEDRASPWLQKFSGSFREITPVLTQEILPNRDEGKPKTL